MTSSRSSRTWPFGRRRYLRLELARSTRPQEGRPPTANIEAYDLYLRGLVASNRASRDGVEDAVRYFERATELDPQFSQALAAWANLYVAVSGDTYPVQEVMPRARRARRSGARAQSRLLRGALHPRQHRDAVRP